MRTVLTFSVFFTQYSSGLFWALDMVCHCIRLQPTINTPHPNTTHTNIKELIIIYNNFINVISFTFIIMIMSIC